MRFAVQTMAERTLITLDWLNSPRLISLWQQADEDQTTLICLKQELIKLLHGLLMGHLPNPNLDVNSIFFIGLPALLQDWLVVEDTSPQLTEVCVALMKRVPSIVDRYDMQPQAEGDASFDYSDDGWQLLRCYTSIWWIFGMLGFPLTITFEIAARHGESACYGQNLP